MKSTVEISFNLVELGGITSAMLSTDHPQSSYGIPVLLVNGEAYGPASLYFGVPMRDFLMLPAPCLGSADILMENGAPVERPDPMRIFDYDAMPNPDYAQAADLIARFKGIRCAPGTEFVVRADRTLEVK